jgi:hypothetical protein
MRVVVSTSDLVGKKHLICQRGAKYPNRPVFWRKVELSQTASPQLGGRKGERVTHWDGKICRMAAWLRAEIDGGAGFVSMDSSGEVKASGPSRRTGSGRAAGHLRRADGCAVRRCGKTIQVDAFGSERYKRILAVVRDGPVNIDLLMVVMGYAEVYRDAAAR